MKIYEWPAVWPAKLWYVCKDGVESLLIKTLNSQDKSEELINKFMEKLYNDDVNI